MDDDCALELIPFKNGCHQVVLAVVLAVLAISQMIKANAVAAIPNTRVQYGADGCHNYSQDEEVMWARVVRMRSDCDHLHWGWHHALYWLYYRLHGRLLDRYTYELGLLKLWLSFLLVNISVLVLQQ